MCPHGFERFIRKTIPVDCDHPFHDDFAEKKNGRQGDGLPQAPWIHPANRNKGNRKRNGHTSFKGRRQPDFGQRRG